MHVIRNNEQLEDKSKKRLTEKIIAKSITEIGKHETITDKFIEDITSFLRNIASISGIKGTDEIKELGEKNTIELHLSGIVGRNIKNSLGEKGAPMIPKVRKC